MKNFKTIILTTFALTLICGISALGLAYTNKLTAPEIAKAAQKAQFEAMGRVIPADKYPEDTVSLNGEHSYNIAMKGDEIKGYIFTVSKNGYGGAVTVMTGIDLDGKVIAIEVLDASNETPGLGQNVTKSTFWEQFKGKTEGITVGGDIDGVTGATISSRAVADCVNTAFDYYKLIVKEGE